MTFARIRLLVAGLLFLGWIGYLAYLAFTVGIHRPEILSRPQFMISTFDIVATVKSPDEQFVDVKKVHWPKGPNGKALEGKKIAVNNLSLTKDHWKGSGDYILPLIKSAEGKNGEDVFEVAAVPHSPGFPPNDKPKADRPRIYFAEPETLRQLELISKP